MWSAAAAEESWGGVAANRIRVHSRPPKTWGDPEVHQEIRKPREGLRGTTAMSVLRGQEKHEEAVCVSIREGSGKMGDFVVLFPSLSIPCYVHVPPTLH